MSALASLRASAFVFKVHGQRFSQMLTENMIEQAEQLRPEQADALYGHWARQQADRAASIAREQAA